MRSAAHRLVRSALHEGGEWTSPRLGDPWVTRVAALGVRAQVRFPEIAEEFSIDTSVYTKQLPTVAMFYRGREVRRFVRWAATQSMA